MIIRNLKIHFWIMKRNEMIVKYTHLIELTLTPLAFIVYLYILLA